MFRDDVLSRIVQRRRFWRSITISLIVFFDVCFLLEFTAFAVLVKSGKFTIHAPAIETSSSSTTTSERRSQISPKSTEKKMPPMLTEAEPSTKPPQFFSEPNSTILQPDIDRFTHRGLFKDIPLPPARPRQSSLPQTPEKSDDLNKAAKKRSSEHNATLEQRNEDKQQPLNRLKPSDIDARRTTALDLERSYANAGVTISTKISGPDGTMLSLEYSQFNDTLVQNIMSVPSFAATLRDIGFKTIAFIGTQNKKWVFQLSATLQSKAKSGEARPMPNPLNDHSAQHNHTEEGKPLQLLQN
jgi:hypothetical protein